MAAGYAILLAMARLRPRPSLNSSDLPTPAPADPPQLQKAPGPRDARADRQAGDGAPKSLHRLTANGMHGSGKKKVRIK